MFKKTASTLFPDPVCQSTQLYITQPTLHRIIWSRRMLCHRVRSLWHNLANCFKQLQSNKQENNKRCKTFISAVKQF